VRSPADGWAAPCKIWHHGLVGSAAGQVLMPVRLQCWSGARPLDAGRRSGTLTPC